jgi:hypothetical protein
MRSVSWRRFGSKLSRKSCPGLGIPFVTEPCVNLQFTAPSGSTDFHSFHRPPKKEKRSKKERNGYYYYRSNFPLTPTGEYYKGNRLIAFMLHWCCAGASRHRKRAAGPFWTAAACCRFLRLDVKLRQLADALLQWPDRQFPKTNAASRDRGIRLPLKAAACCLTPRAFRVEQRYLWLVGLVSYEEGTESCFQENKMTRWYDDDTFWENLDWFFFSQFCTP